MNSKNVLKLVFGVLAGSAIVFGQPSTYDIDTAHSSAQFSVRHLMISNVKGEFSKVTGTIVYDSKNLAASKIDAVIDTNTISTRDAKRDEHLKSADFFETAKYPTLQFKSKELKRVNGNLQIKGDLTIHGVTKEVVLAVDGPTPEIKDPWGLTRVGATATTRINRKDWGLTFNSVLETGGVAIGDEVLITLDIEATKDGHNHCQQGLPLRFTLGGTEPPVPPHPPSGNAIEAQAVIALPEDPRPFQLSVVVL